MQNEIEQKAQEYLWSHMEKNSKEMLLHLAATDKIKDDDKFIVGFTSSRNRTLYPDDNSVDYSPSIDKLHTRSE